MPSRFVTPAITATRSARYAHNGRNLPAFGALAARQIRANASSSALIWPLLSERSLLLRVRIELLELRGHALSLCIDGQDIVRRSQVSSVELPNRGADRCHV